VTHFELESILVDHNGYVVIPFWVQPKASKSRIMGLYGDKVKLAITAPPVDGKANKEVCKFVAKLFKLPKTSVTIVAGESSRRKLVAIPIKDKDSVIEKIIDGYRK
jgi:uncharacterized protein (TIGR00251 family)